MKDRNICSLAWVGLLIWTLDPSAAEALAPKSFADPWPRPIPYSATGTEDAANRDGISITRSAEDRTIDQGALSALNLLGIRYAKGEGVKRNPGMAMRFFLRSSMQGYTPAMVNLGTLYQFGVVGHRDFRRAYAWVRTALSFGVPEEDHDATVLKLGMIAARLDPRGVDRAERLAGALATRIVDACQCSPGQETEFAYDASL